MTRADRDTPKVDYVSFRGRLRNLSSLGVEIPVA